MLRKLRIALALIFIVGITLLFAGIGQGCLGWMARIQFLPACLALNAGAIIGISLLTLLVGRIYCSVICPLGIFQDAVLFLRKKTGGKKHGRKFTYSPERKLLRYVALGIFILLVIFGVNSVYALVAPYSAYGRMVASVLHPSWSIVTVTAIVTFLGIGFLAALYGRIWCNTICPVGTVLSLFSRFSLFRPVIDEDKCIRCHHCEKHCKASCIDSSFELGIDYSRCVDCFDCMDGCPEKAISFRFAYGKKSAPAQQDKDDNNGRRAFLTAGALLVGAAAAKASDGGLAPVIDKEKPERTERIVPPGAESVDAFYNHCTACQLCVSACPNKVLRPSGDLEHLMQPEMNYDKGFCRPECTACSDVCPTGAIKKLLEGQKLNTRIGVASVNPELCLVNRDGVSCGNCARHCPFGAITMVAKEGSELKVPAVSETRCIGCGACEFLCPSRPISAITVNGLSTHTQK